MTLEKLLRTELKPCPFCGSSAMAYCIKDKEDSKTFRYFCPNCRADMKTKLESEK